MSRNSETMGVRAGSAGKLSTHMYRDQRITSNALPKALSTFIFHIVSLAGL